MAEFKSMPSYFKQTKKRKSAPSVSIKKAKATPTTVVVYRSVPTETKYYMNNDWTAETLDDRVTGASFNFAMMKLAQGTGTGQRVGSQVQAKGLSIKLITRQGTTIGQEFNRIDFWMDTQPNAANATWGALYDGGATRLDEINASVTEAARKRFRLLRSLVFSHRNFLTNSTGPVDGIVRESKQPRKEPDPHSIRVYDLEKQEWRSFRFDRLKKVTAELTFE